MEIDVRYMRRALELAARGRGFTSPNPMVGAVVVSPDGRIIGQGWHRRCGEAHAEVNAVNSISPEDRSLIPQSVMYVTLEPCAHTGKTPPCATMLVKKGFRKVVVGALDVFAKVNGRGVEILREAGCEVVTGVLAEESRRLNAVFFTAHTHRRPFVMLKWAQSADGFMDVDRETTGGAPAKFSTPLTSVLMHRLRADYDAIAVGARTIDADNPRLDVRLWPGRNPRPVIIGTPKIDALSFNCSAPLAYSFSADGVEAGVCLRNMLADLYSRGITSLMVEGGARTLGVFIQSGLWDLARVEVSPQQLGVEGRVIAPVIGKLPEAIQRLGPNIVNFFSNNPLNDVKNL